MKSRKTASCKGQTTSGFTLIELLVVVAIIGILAGLMFPALNIAKRRAMSTECASNLRQMYAANTTFAADHGGRGVNEHGALHWFQLLGPYVSGRNNTESCGPEMRCPAGEANAVFGGDYNEGTWEGVDYGLTTFGQHFAGVQNPMRAPMFMDTHEDSALMDIVTFGAMLTAHRKAVLRHPGKGDGALNVIFCDGHVETLSIEAPADLMPPLSGPPPGPPPGP
jgi:prepilin-type N-terminal cleavage/methylation domain-containing protein/prepilin-type processing-associated H-X9-DG protein